MQTITKIFLTQKQAISKYPFLTKNMLKNLLYSNRGGFRTKVVRKLGRRVLLDEEAFLKFLSNSGGLQSGSKEGESV